MSFRLIWPNETLATHFLIWICVSVRRRVGDKGVVLDARAAAAAYLVKLPPFPLVVTSDGPTAALFTNLSGITHLMLQRSWGQAPRADGTTHPDPNFPPGLTSCNGFVGIYGNGTNIALPGRSLGQFLLESKLKSWGKSFAWIPSTAGARPKFGDIFEVQGRTHIGISLDFVGNTWHTAEGGQGGSQSKRDIIKRKQVTQTDDFVRTDRSEQLKGWVDIDLFVNGPPPTALPNSMLGWWSIPWRGRVFFYFFESNFKASWTFTKPVSDAMTPFKFDDTATVTLDGPTSITLKWSATGSVEKFTQTGTGREMAGMWNGVEPLFATKLF
jgi:hypothetical protein